MVGLTYSAWTVGPDGKVAPGPYDSNVGKDLLKIAVGGGRLLLASREPESLFLTLTRAHRNRREGLG